MRKVVAAFFVALLSTLSTGAIVQAQEFAQRRLPYLVAGFKKPGVAQPLMTSQVVAKASADECFTGIGQPLLPISDAGVCSSGSVQKTNQAYLWGVTQVGDGLWFGTGANIFCQVLTGYLGVRAPFLSEGLVCEFAQSKSGVGDHRAPRMYRYDVKTKVLKELTPAESGKALGIRSGGSLGQVVFLGGPSSFQGQPSVTLFAFDAEHQIYLGSKTFSQYSDIRKWLVVRGVLYAGVQNSADGRGRILRWRGNCSDLWQFEEVADLPLEAANIALYQGSRLAISTWPSGSRLAALPAGVILGPVIPKGGLTTKHFHNRNWKEVFSFAKYDPDPIMSYTYQGGDLKFYDGWLYWGSMHVPGLSWGVHKEIFGSDAAGNEQDALLGTWRASTIWRGRYLETDTPQIELLYGERQLPKYDFDLFTHQGSRKFVMSSTGWRPRYGRSGFGNAMNLYAWEMLVSNGSLFVGTFDVGSILGNQLKDMGLFPPEVAQFPFKQYGTSGYGADIWRFDSSNTAAKLESKNGLGNRSNYGIRTMLRAADGKSMYVGTANPFNLDPAGGWELISMKPRRAAGAFCINHGKRDLRCLRNARLNSRGPRVFEGPNCVGLD